MNLDEEKCNRQDGYNREGFISSPFKTISDKDKKRGSPFIKCLKLVSRAEQIRAVHARVLVCVCVCVCARTRLCV